MSAWLELTFGSIGITALDPTWGLPLETVSGLVGVVIPAWILAVMMYEVTRVCGGRRARWLRAGVPCIPVAVCLVWGDVALVGFQPIGCLATFVGQCACLAGAIPPSWAFASLGRSRCV